MKRILLLTLLLISSFGFGQEPVIQWQKSLGGFSSDLATAIQQTSDGGYVIVGWSSSNEGDVTGHIGFFDLWIVKLDATGNLTWQESLGGSLNENAMSVQQTADEGYILAGGSMSSDGDLTENKGEMDYWVLKLDATGNITWQKSLGGSEEDQAKSVHQTSDGGYIVAGNTKSNDGDVISNNGERDCWILKLDSSGGIIWQKSLGGSGYDWAESIRQTTDGGYIVAGNSSSSDGDLTENHGLTDCWIIKLDESGTIEWQKSLGGSENENAKAIRQTMDGGYVFAGYSESNDVDITENNGGDDCWVVKLDSIGDIMWKESYGGTSEDISSSIEQTSEGGYVVGGWTRSENGDISANNGLFDYWVMKLDAYGYITWRKTLGGSAMDKATGVQQTVDGGYVVCGESMSNDGDITNSYGARDYWVVKLSSESVSVIENVKTEVILYPNPTSNTFTISSENTINSAYKVISAEGKEVLSDNMNGKEQTIDISNVSKGVYSVVFENSELPVLSVIKE